MLMNTIKKSYRDMFGYAEQIQPIVTVPVKRSAANASNYGQSEMQARRLRRQRRLENVGVSGSNGWRIRTW